MGPPSAGGDLPFLASSAACAKSNAIAESLAEPVSKPSQKRAPTDLLELTYELAYGPGLRGRPGLPRHLKAVTGATTELGLLLNPLLYISNEHDRLQRPLPAERSALDPSSHADVGPSSLVSLLLKENERLRTAVVSSAASESDARPISDILTDIPGTFQKSKFFGHSHWMNAMEPYEALGDANTTVNPTTDRVEVNKSTDLYKTVSELKTIGRILKSARMLLPTISPEAVDSLPLKTTCDVLVDGYLRTFEGVFRVLHVPSFHKEYEDHWSGKTADKPSVLLKIMLVCAIGVPFYTGADQPRLRVTCAKWIQAAESWLAAPHAKSRLNMAGLQIQILVLLAKQICNIEGDHVWIPAGSLLRTAMYLGLHRDPSYFGKINTFHVEMRRRLWETVLELTVQSSMDMGMPPMISVHDYDTKPPSNVNDEDLREQDDAPLSVKPSDVCTDCSIQIAFADTLPLRLEFVRLINNLRFDLPYSECLRLGNELTTLCQSKTDFLKDALSHGANITPFQIKLHDALVRRFTLGLHRPYFAKAKDNPTYHFSRTLCLDTSLAILAPATPPIPGQPDDWTLLTHRAAGFFKALILYATSTVYFELHTQIAEHSHTWRLTAPLISNTTPAIPTLPPQSQPLLAALKSAHSTALARLQSGETNGKGVVFFACALARIDALLAGTNPEVAVLEAATSAVKEMRILLADVYLREHGEPIDLASSGREGVFGPKGHGRGDGADDVTGRGVVTGTGTARCEDANEEANATTRFGLRCGLDADSQDSSGSIEMLDFNTQFLQDPEWFFNGAFESNLHFDFDTF
ncbi:hypothetical protein EKO04_010937 [Ascochyta lentis]|uniref:Xylanolytic transcriptional activator regulatory domain-containing protein n=1 Tax=Ascochyta lentis TaxID=205686 RepID=A0A8H7MCW3_9PLEO|nr:hypothetical protein EKO04_010937 [Ascochyta lentis]